MPKKILPGEMPSKTGTKRNGGAIPGKPSRPAPKVPNLPDRKPGRPTKPSIPRIPRTGKKDGPGAPTSAPSNPGKPDKSIPEMPVPGRGPNPSYRAFKNSISKPGIQPGEKEALARIQKNRGVDAAEARRIAKRRTAKGLPVARMTRGA